MRSGYATSQGAAPDTSLTFEVRVAAGAPTSLVPAVKSPIAGVNCNISLQFKTLALQIDQSLSRERLLATLSAFFGGLALLLVLRMILNEIAVLIGAGLLIGLGAALATTRFLGGFLYGMKPNDPRTLAIAAAVLALVAVLAGFTPARRTSRLDPMNALREE